MKFYLRYITSFIIRFRFIIIFGIIFGIIFSFLILFIFPRFKIQRITRIGLTGRYTTNTLPSQISEKISKGLVHVDESSRVTPLLANKWTVLEDGKKWVFEIDEKLKWHDNKTLKISDIDYYFEDISVTKDGNTITFELNEPYVPFVVLLEKPIFKKGLLGIGDWKVNKLSLKNDFLQSLEITNGKEKIVYKFYPTEDQTKLAFKMGEVDKIENMYTKNPFLEWKNVEIQNVTKTDQVVVIFINTEDPVLSKKNLRQALNYAIDKNIFETKAISPISPKSIYYNPQVKLYSYDSDKAKQLITDMDKEIPEDFSIKLISNPNLIDTADEITKMWRAVGIKSDVLVSSVIPSDYQAFITIFDIPKDPDQYSLWHSTQSDTNITRYKNLRIDKLLEDGRIELNFEERKKIYLDFQRFLLEDSPAIFLYHPVWYNISRK